MKKFLILPLVALPLVACDGKKQCEFDIKNAKGTNYECPQPNSAYFETLDNAVKGAEKMMMTDSDCATAYYQVAATPELLAIYNQPKDSMFNVGDAAYQNTADNCVINVWGENHYRIFCGTAENISSDEMWAVSVCK